MKLNAIVNEITVEISVEELCRCPHECSSFKYAGFHNLLVNKVFNWEISSSESSKFISILKRLCRIVSKFCPDGNEY